MSRFLDWFDDRTGCRALVHDALYEQIPGGARWRYVWGSTLVFAFFVQLVTGLVLWTAYSPSAQTAWESVYFIQHEMPAGWLLRGVHHYMAHTMVVLLALHFVQVVVDGAYRAPREINFWIGLVMMLIVLGMALTGYLLPWDEKGYWATKVATNMVALVPLVGEPLQRLLVGGSEYGHHTLTRFFALHAGALPGLLAVCLVAHLALFRRHGIKARDPYRKPDTTFWPDQALRDAIACLAVMIVVLGLIVRHYHPSRGTEVPLAGVLAPELGAPADPAENYSAARPETYFLFLFQLLKHLEAFPPVVGAVIVPGLVLLTLFLMPIVGRWELGHRFNVVWTIALLVGAGLLTALALRDDYNGQTEHSRHYLAAVEEARLRAERAVALAGSLQGIPPTGALAMLRADRKSQGPKLFRQHCAVCHSHAPDGNTSDPAQVIVADSSTAANLWGFGSGDWIRGILNPETIAGPNYFGNTALREGDMVTFVEDTFGTHVTEDMDDDQRDALRRSVEDVTFALAAEAGLVREMATDVVDRVAAGREAIVNEFACIDCHKFHDEGELGLAPDLTGYGSRAWLRAIIANPEHERFYPDTNDRMPAFADSDDPAANRLSREELDLLVAWLRGDWYEPGADRNPPAQASD